jgi:hypothetical protein
MNRAQMSFETTQEACCEEYWQTVKLSEERMIILF